MASSFTAAGVMALAPALAVRLGANVGTALVAQMLSFNVAVVAPPLVLCGVLAFRWSSGGRVRNLGRATIGLGLMLMALAGLQATLGPVENTPLLHSFLESLAADPLLAVLLAAIITWGCHSSVVMVLLVGSLAANHVISAPETLALVLGANVGGALPPMLHASTVAARRVPLGNLLVRLTGVVLLLPHGYDGQGPDHSSARVERFLSLCAQDNMTVAMPTTPASYFHLLRWQALSSQVKPLIVFTPKSMLRLKTATSPVAAFTSGSFRPVLGEQPGTDDAAVRTVLLCAGKIYYDLAAKRQADGLAGTAIVRVERLYPLPADELLAELSRYPGAEEVRWVQEEPANMGGWPYMALRLGDLLGRPIRLESLPASSAPAGGSAKAHAAEHADLVSAALRPRR